MGKLKPLDIVKTPGAGIAIVSEIADRSKSGHGFEVSVNYLDGCNPAKEKNAWWKDHELVLLDNIPRILSSMIAHSFGSAKNQGDIYYPLERKSDNNG